ncbi:CHAD domain-containing protein [Actinomadura rugatobispora]|uniref:CHAD domain-containing protein n=1 Tax=Actinomadura rugatobispora TaxID=1994 RepID=A0ABW1AJ02_9ACTN|nr:CYTH and CHAD domain-containing protein [Actinomadura rugatobispora]
MAVKHVEIERKYDAAADFAVPELTVLPGVASVSAPETHHLHATYFDTADLRLAARGITLRRRRGGTDAGWHLKIPAGPDSKNELRAPLGRAHVVPARLAGLVAAYARGAELRPVATLETDRTVLRLLDDSGEVLAEVADDAVTGRVLDEGSGDAWREIEVELAAGARDLLKAAGKRLRKAGARKASSSSKLGRLLNGQIARPTAQETGRQALARIAAPAPTAGDAAVAYLAAQVEALLAYDPKVRLAEFDAVHRMRVATRRMRSVLQSYRPVLDRERTDPLREELKWLAAVLGEVRDLEVLRMRFTERVEGLEGIGEPAWLEELAKQEQAAYRRVNTALKLPRYYALLDALEALVADPPLTARAGRDATAELPRLVVRAWKRLADAYDGVAASEDPELTRHEVRKDAKRARYAAEAAVAVLGDPAKQTVKNAKRLQEVLGGYQDGVIASEHLRGAAERARDTADAFTLGVLYGIERCEAQAALDRLEGTWADIPAPAF